MTEPAVVAGRVDGSGGRQRLRILYDTYWWGRGPQSARVVVRDLLRAWRTEFPDDEFVLAVRKRDRADVEDAFPGCVTVVIRGRPHGIAILTQLAFHARRHNVDLAYTQNFAPAGVWTAVFVHDVLFQTDPQWFTRAERAYYRLIPLFARRANLVLTSSKHEAARIRACNPGIHRVADIGLSVSTELTRATPVQPSVAEDLDSFVLTVGRLNVRKNLARTIQGALESGVLSRKRPLIVVGGEHGKGAGLPSQVHRAVDAGLVVFVPEVGDAQLAWLYAHADLFLCLSLDEGFGLPPVEALHFGCPVIVSDIDVFRETLRGAASYVDPQDPGAIAAAIRLAGTERRALPTEFPSWHDCARRARAAIESARVGVPG